MADSLDDMAMVGVLSNVEIDKAHSRAHIHGLTKNDGDVGEVLRIRVERLGVGKLVSMVCAFAWSRDNWCKIQTSWRTYMCKQSIPNWS